MSLKVIFPFLLTLAFCSATTIQKNLDVLTQLGSHYVMQHNEKSCGLASVTMLINTLRSIRNPQSKSITQDHLLTKLGNEVWNQAFSSSGSGLSLDEFAIFLRDVFDAYEFWDVGIETVHVSHLSTSVHQYLKNILSNMFLDEALYTFLIVNFDQSMLTPTNFSSGHLSPVGDYRSYNKTVKILDVDLDWTGPYWVTVETLLKGMNTIDASSSEYRGYIRVFLDKTKILHEVR